MCDSRYEVQILHSAYDLLDPVHEIRMRNEIDAVYNVVERLLTDFHYDAIFFQTEAAAIW